MSGSILYSTALLIVLLGLIVFARNSRSRTQRLFLPMTLACALWIISNALFGQLENTPAYTVALVSYAAAAAVSVLFFLFACDLGEVWPKRWRWFVAGGIALCAISVLPGVLAIEVHGRTIITTPFIFVYASVLMVIFTAGLWILFRARYKQHGLRRRQVSTVLLGVMAAIIGGVLFNLLLPLVGDYRFVELGPAFTICFIVTAAYAIVRHRLFDLRATVLRVAAYSLAVVSVATIYVVLVYVVAVPFLNGNVGQFVYLVLAVLAALTFQPIKNFFDTTTRAIFYKDAYETKKVLDDLGSILVREVEVSRLAHRGMAVLREAIKSPNIGVVLLHNDKMIGRRITIGNAFKDTEELLHALVHKSNDLLVADEIEPQGGRLHQLFVASGIGVASPLMTSKVRLGYLFVGYKASGDAFSSQDVELIHLFADELAVAVQNALRFEEIAHFNETLKQEIHDATAELRESNRKLQRLDEAKDEFISMASHQLRTPLTSVKGYLSMILEGDVGKVDPDQRKVLLEAYGSAQRMVYLIGDFLNVSRLSTGRFAIERAPVDLPRAVKEEVEQLAATASRRDIRLEFHLPTQFPEVMVDENKIRQVVMNFIDNAIFYSKPGGVVAVELLATSKEAIFRVHDSGIGVPESERHKIFTKFFRASNARRVRPDGTGVGLFMAQKVIVAHGGSVIFESKLNRGSTFGFALPLKNPAQQFKDKKS